MPLSCWCLGTAVVVVVGFLDASSLTLVCLTHSAKIYYTINIPFFHLHAHMCCNLSLAHFHSHFFFLDSDVIIFYICLPALQILSFNDSLAYFFHFIILIWVHCAPIKYSFAFVAFNSELFYFIFFGWHKKKEITRDISKKEWEIQFRLKKWAVN